MKLTDALRDLPPVVARAVTLGALGNIPTVREAVRLAAEREKEIARKEALRRRGYVELPTGEIVPAPKSSKGLPR